MLSSASTFRQRLLRWYDHAHRDLPWRVHSSTGREPDPYHVLVSEAMLQQTQVAAVVPYFNRFVARFRTLSELAGADEQEVLRLWQGLGYYSRARNLRAAARKVVADFGGELPRDVGDLLELPGVGRYTAGAIASIAFGRRAPILDGNVVRVLCRLDKIESDPRDKPTQALLWRRAEEILPSKRLGDFNSALMELGATVCIPRSPHCLVCPVRAHCEAFAANAQDAIPAPRRAKPTPLFYREIYCIRRETNGGEWLIEQRPAKGRWAGMWQFVTLPAPHHAPEGGATQTPPLPVPTGPPTRVGEVTHGLTHRRYHFAVFRCPAVGVARLNETDDGQPPRAWVSMENLAAYPLPRPHLRVAEMLQNSPA